MTCLRVYTQHMYPQQTTRFQDLLVRLPEVNIRTFNESCNNVTWKSIRPLNYTYKYQILFVTRYSNTRPFIDVKVFKYTQGNNRTSRLKFKNKPLA